MRFAHASRLAVCTVLLAGFVPAAFAANVLIGDAKSQPESLTVAPDGVAYVGSASSPFVYRVRAGATTAEKFIDASAEGPGTWFFGMLADASSKTLWTCQLTPVPNSMPQHRHTALRGFDLATGAPRLRWNLPGDDSICNDFALGPDHALYISDTVNGKIYRLARGATSADLFLENTALLKGIDGITFLNGTLYVNNVGTNKIYRVPTAGGKAGEPVEIVLDKPVSKPDGMRAANGRLFVAENGGGKISAITVSGDKGTVTVLKDGLKTPTGVEPAGDALWFTERAIGMAESMPMPK